MTMFSILETVGIISFSISGMLLAEQKNFDPVGWYIIACVTAFGGGTLRDVILDLHPVYWITRWEYPVLILFLTGIFYFISRFRIPNSALIITDAMGLGLFTITGAQTAYDYQYPFIIVLILAVMTATFGGVIRDTLCGEVPMIFQKVSLYASVSFFGALLFMLLLQTSLESHICVIISVVFTFAFRLTAYRYNLRFR